MYEVLFAPERETYSKKSVKDLDCIFCGIVNEDSRVWTREVYRDEEGVVIMNIYPYSPGQLQILPSRHVEDIENLLDEEIFHLSKLLLRGFELCKSVLNPVGWNFGLNIGDSGKSISHLHLQLVPRFERSRKESQKEIHEKYLEKNSVFEQERHIESGGDCDCFSNLEHVFRKSPYIYLSEKPYNRGHLVFSPKEHIESFNGVSAEKLSSLLKLAASFKKILEKVYNPVGVNIGANLGKVPNSQSHFQLHLVPRYRPESGFMEVIGNSRVVRESLGRTFQKINTKLG